jgi:hypothetical protein
MQLYGDGKRMKGNGMWHLVCLKILSGGGIPIASRRSSCGDKNAVAYM